MYTSLPDFLASGKGNQLPTSSNSLTGVSLFRYQRIPFCSVSLRADGPSQNYLFAKNEQKLKLCQLCSNERTLPLPLRKNIYQLSSLSLPSKPTIRAFTHKTLLWHPLNTQGPPALPPISTLLASLPPMPRILLLRC
jgi:hypothetical protein